VGYSGSNNIKIHVPGAAEIWIAQADLGGGSGGTEAGKPRPVGYSRNGVTITYEDFWIDVPGDEHGGDDGPPIDVQHLGRIARVRIELTKFDTTAVAAIKARVANTLFGRPVPIAASGSDPPAARPPGTLMFTNSYTMKLTIRAVRGDAEVHHFPRAFLRAAIDLNVATKFQSPILEFECHKDSDGVLENTVTTDLFAL
jgi:hypothetical protein